MEEGETTGTGGKDSISVEFTFLDCDKGNVVDCGTEFDSVFTEMMFLAEL